jgi:pyridoxal phosphate enzyme (YggS family)
MAELLAELQPGRVRANVAAVRDRLEQACARAGRDPGKVELLAATKYVPLELMGALPAAGIELVGENTGQALQAKHQRWADTLTFDFIGHLQSRKVQQVLPLVRMVHSVQSESVLDQVKRHGQRATCLLMQVNVAGEASKDGLPADRVDAFLESASERGGIRFSGLMTMPPLALEPEEARPHFAALRALAERLQRDWAPHHDFSILSMGTSQDFEVAVEEGATICRLGGVLYE